MTAIAAGNAAPSTKTASVLSLGADASVAETSAADTLVATDASAPSRLFSSELAQAFVAESAPTTVAEGQVVAASDSAEATPMTLDSEQLLAQLAELGHALQADASKAPLPAAAELSEAVASDDANAGLATTDATAPLPLASTTTPSHPADLGTNATAIVVAPTVSQQLATSELGSDSGASADSRWPQLGSANATNGAATQATPAALTNQASQATTGAVAVAIDGGIEVSGEVTVDEGESQSPATAVNNKSIAAGLHGSLAAVIATGSGDSDLDPAVMTADAGERLDGGDELQPGGQLLRAEGRHLAQAGNPTANPSGSAEQALRQPLNAQQLAPELRDRLQMMVNSNNLTAEIRLDPPELGALQIRVQMNGDQANLQIITQQAQARELIDQALPRLREMLQQQGLSLGQTQVSQQSGGESRSHADQQQGHPAGASLIADGGDGDVSTGQWHSMAGRHRDGGIDYYA
ncbi:flagellar hook-length control protein FliK [Ferrimonas senticii]|uniref:flagellar hook-length control protein FliK n=1 Tax=Ferrimonas senticii TaxID=394566 RepID=UPI0004848E9A|nr:flagellar hook-length control protein FliK [Ferrimonas senticii]